VEGHRDTHLFRDVDQPDSYLIVSDWSSEEAFHEFIGSEGFRSVTDWGREQILSTRPTHTVYRR
jgi:heme-degrading monooxygenase HmoA